MAGSGWLLGGRYRVIDRIGAGGMAEVFRAHDELLARDVAVKVFRTLPPTPDTASGVERQEIELHALARLNHPNLITLFDGSISGADGPAFLVMELINGPSLSARIAEGPLTESEAREVGIQIADALAYVHSEGMVHRDVKPGNILLGTDGAAGDGTVRARLSDFGIVRLLGSERLTSVDFTLGTAFYLAPEQARGSDVGPVADVYSLGLVLIEALTGVRSFDGPAVDAVVARLSRGPEVPADLPPPWPVLLATMTGGDPESRPTAGQVAQTLRDGRTRPAPLPLAAGAVPAAALAPVATQNTAGAAGPPGLAEAETVGLAALGSPAAPVSPSLGYPWEPTAGPGPRWRAGWLLAAALFVAALAVGSVLLLRPSAKSKPPADPGLGGTHQKTHSVSVATHANPSPPTSHSTTRTNGAATSSAPHSTSPAPSSSSARTSRPAPSTRTSTTPSTTPSTPGTSATATGTPPAVAADPSPAATTTPPLP